MSKQHITLLKSFLGEKVNSILEIQCGDSYDIENCVALQDKNLKYIGVDVVDEVIQNNRQYFRNDKNKLFMILDASNEPLPQCDLVVCSGMMEYLPIANIWSLIENIRDSKAKYVAFDYYHSPINDLKINEDINIELQENNLENEEYSMENNNDVEKNKTNKNKKTNTKKVKENSSNEALEHADTKNEADKELLKRAINLTHAPFYFPQPKFLITTENMNHSIALYEIKDIELFMDWHNDDISYLRSKLVGYLEKDFNKIRSTFAKYNNGEELFKNAITADKIDWNKIYYNEPYKTIVDSNDIFKEYINFLLLIYMIQLDRLKESEIYQNLLTEDNFIWASIIAKDFIKWKYNELF